jgi:hypothetical protein
MHRGNICAQAEPGPLPQPEAAALGVANPGLATRSESLDYLLEIIGELGALAARAGYPTLAGILDLAQREANVQRKAS